LVKEASFLCSVEAVSPNILSIKEGKGFQEVKAGMSQSGNGRIEFRYDPAICDLCGSSKFRIVLDMPDGSLTSDVHIVESGLRKIQCLDCDLIRNGYALSYEWLRAHYEDEYELGAQAAISEPLFFTERGPVPRSQVVFDWMIENLKAVKSNHPRTALEVGCGEGSLLSQFAHRLSGCKVSGMDVSGRSVTKARERGLKVKRGTYKDVAGYYELIYSFAVIEHVPSPSDFLNHLKTHLAPGGLLITAQPCQDSSSNDIFLLDHLHHFFSQHVAELGRRAGLREIKRSTDNPYIPDFSLHVFKRDNEGFLGRPERIAGDNLAFDRTIAKWKAIFHNLDTWLDHNAHKRLAVWGVGQTFMLLCAYTKLRTHPIATAFDDNPERFSQSGFEFPVGRFEEAMGLDDPGLAVLLTFVPGTQVLERLKAKSVQYFCPLI
jgi:SAM-dependent methyltransferase